METTLPKITGPVPSETRLYLSAGLSRHARAGMITLGTANTWPQVPSKGDLA